MKRYFFLIITVILSLNLLAQKRPNKDRHFRGKITEDIRGNLQYENKEGIRAEFSTNVFGDKVYEDSRGNKVTYAKNIKEDIFPHKFYDDRDIFKFLIEVSDGKTNRIEEYKRDIHGNIIYEEGRNFKASLAENIFEDLVYKDTRNNEIKYSKEFKSVLMQQESRNEVGLFFSLIDRYAGQSDFQEEYDVDIFGALKYKNNKNRTASWSEDIFDNMIYKDSAGNEEKYSPERLSRIVESYGSEKRFFISLVQRRLLRE